MSKFPRLSLIQGRDSRKDRPTHLAMGRHMRISILAVLLAISTLGGCSSDPTEEPQTENLREEEPMVSLPQLAYDVAYFVLP